MRRRLVLLFLFFVAGFLAYHNSFQAPFVFDDLRSIVPNENIRKLWPLWVPLQDTSRPLVQLTLALNFAISGLSVWSYHLLNLLIHVAAALALFAVIRITLRKYHSGQLSNDSNGVALAIALCWMLHPLQTESVTYMIQRGEAMMGLFCLLMLLCFIMSIDSPRRTSWQLTSLLCCVLGLMTKPVMAIAPLLVLVYDRTFIGKTFSNAVPSRWRYYLATFATVGLLPVILNGNRGDWATSVGGNAIGISPLQYAASQPGIILYYLRLVFWPDALCLDYGLRPEENVWFILGTSLPLLLLIALTLYALKKGSAAGFAGAWVCLTLAPSSSFIPIADLAFEHRMYLALAGVLALAIPLAYLALSKGLDALAVAPRQRNLILCGVVLITCGLLSVRTVLRNEDYRTEIDLWISATEARPESARAQYNLGTALLRQQRATEAVEHFSKAIAIRPSYPEASYNLGNALQSLGRLPEAIISYRRALSFTPNDWQMHNNLGVAMLKSGDKRLAEIEFQRALRLNPNCSSANRNLETIRQSTH